MKFSVQARMTAEFVGTAFLLAAVVGSGIMGERLAGGNVAIALLANTIATGAEAVIRASFKSKRAGKIESSCGSTSLRKLHWPWPFLPSTSWVM